MDYERDDHLLLRLWTENKVQLVFGGVGIVLLMLGLVDWSRNRLPADVVEVQVLGDSDSDTLAKLVVDVGGAVKQPGVYSLLSPSRIGDAIQKAGGLHDDADQGWVSQNLNLASEISDGQKIYVPFLNSDSSQGGGVTKVGSDNFINVNTATVEELDSLWGIGASRADAIIKNRPYSNVSELLSKAGVPQSVIDENQGSIRVY